MTLYTLALQLTALLAFWLALASWQHRESTPALTCFTALNLSVVLWCAGALLQEVGSLDLWLVTKIRYAGLMALPSLWLGVAAHAARLPWARLLPWFPMALMVPEIGLYALLYMGAWADLFLVRNHGLAHGPLWPAHMYYSYALILAGAAIFLGAALRMRGSPLGWRRFAVAAGSLVPLAGNVVHVILDGSSGPDPTPVLLGVTLILLRGAVFSGGLFDVLPVTQRDLLEQLPVPVILTDLSGTVIDMNPAAERRLGLLRIGAAGRTLEAVLSHTPVPVRFETAPVEGRRGVVARFVVLEPGVEKTEPETASAA